MMRKMMIRGGGEMTKIRTMIKERMTLYLSQGKVKRNNYIIAG